MKTKLCTKCNENKALNLFSLGKAEFGRHRWCKACMKEYDSNRHACLGKTRRLQIVERRQQIKEQFIEYKKTLKCSKCPESEWYCLDFHHNGIEEKENDISNMIAQGYSVKSIYKEIEKCVVLCSNCHRKLHHAELTI